MRYFRQKFSYKRAKPSTRQKLKHAGHRLHGMHVCLGKHLRPYPRVFLLCVYQWDSSPRSHFPALPRDVYPERGYDQEAPEQTAKKYMLAAARQALFLRAVLATPCDGVVGADGRAPQEARDGEGHGRGLAERLRQCKDITHVVSIFIADSCSIKKILWSFNHKTIVILSVWRLSSYFCMTKIEKLICLGSEMRVSNL